MGKTHKRKPEDFRFYRDAMGTRVSELPRSATHSDKKKYSRKASKKELREAVG